jgi:hypothetical protein
MLINYGGYGYVNELMTVTLYFMMGLCSLFYFPFLLFSGLVTTVSMLPLAHPNVN